MDDDRNKNDDKCIFLAMLLKISSAVSLILGVIGSFYIGNSIGKIKYITDVYYRSSSFDFPSFLSALAVTVITSLAVYAVGEILERVVLCDANLRITYDEIAKLTKNEEGSCK